MRYNAYSQRDFNTKYLKDISYSMFRTLMVYTGLA